MYSFGSPVKPSLYIFTLVFILAMICTLFQRVNVYEEEVGHHKTELSKKQTPDSDGDGSSNGDDNDSDEVTEASYLAVSSDLHWISILTHTHHYGSPVDWYSCQLANRNTPPPKL